MRTKGGVGATCGLILGTALLLGCGGQKAPAHVPTPLAKAPPPGGSSHLPPQPLSSPDATLQAHVSSSLRGASGNLCASGGALAELKSLLTKKTTMERSTGESKTTLARELASQLQVDVTPKDPLSLSDYAALSDAIIVRARELHQQARASSS